MNLIFVHCKTIVFLFSSNIPQHIYILYIFSVSRVKKKTHFICVKTSHEKALGRDIYLLPVNKKIEMGKWPSLLGKWSLKSRNRCKVVHTRPYYTCSHQCIKKLADIHESGTSQIDNMNAQKIKSCYGFCNISFPKYAVKQIK